MSTSTKHPATNRHHGGPGSSQQDATKPLKEHDRNPAPGDPTNPDRSRVSGGGGERDRHHTHDTKTKA
ncbi:MAG TPA: hypothetical protein VEY95_09725 [Azospirillaceae bacterium]|nr:hypothetical protein [Azospirillaceae bacterium]